MNAAVSLDDVKVMLSPEVTVVIPTRGRRPRLAATLAGVRRQRDVELEVIVVDDASTDGTADYVIGLGDLASTLTAGNVLAVPRSAATRHHGTSGHWIGSLDDDHLWAPHPASRPARCWRGPRRRPGSCPIRRPSSIE